MTDEEFSVPRQRMLAVIAAKAIYACARLGKAALAPRVMEVMGRVPQREFVPLELQRYACEDTPFPIGFDKMVLPAGLPDDQRLILVEKDASGVVSTRKIFAVRFSVLGDAAPG